MRWAGRHFDFTFPRIPLVMGIVNVTPDSFSDGGWHLDPAAAIARGRQLVAEGAGLLDIGGESTRPGAAAVSTDEELRRVLPVVEALARDARVPVSIDTRNPAVADAALEAGAAIVNDVEAAREDPAMWKVVTRHGAGYVAMHMQGQPGNMQENPRYGDVVAEVRAFLEDRLRRLAGLGVAPEQVAVDPGIGFGKSLAHNLELLRNTQQLASLGRPVLLGLSRKSFLGRLTGAAPLERLPGSLAATVWCAGQGASVFRTHDVAPTVQALAVARALAGGGT